MTFEEFANSSCDTLKKWCLSPRALAHNLRLKQGYIISRSLVFDGVRYYALETTQLKEAQ